MSKSVELIKKITYIAMMAALATVLSFIQIPYPVAPYMKFDPNDIIILISVVYLGWKSTSLVVFLRSFIRYFNGRGTIFGEIAAFCSSMIFMSTYALIRKLFNSKIKSNVLKYTISCCSALVVATASLMLLNYVFITPSNMRQTFTTGWQLMDQMHMNKATYFTTFIVPVMTFNLIKWSVISVVTGVTQIKLPERYLRRYDSRIEDASLFYKSAEMQTERVEKENEEIKSN